MQILVINAYRHVFRHARHHPYDDHDLYDIHYHDTP